jgi:hypothetical protein
MQDTSDYLPLPIFFPRTYLSLKSAFQETWEIRAAALFSLCDIVVQCTLFSMRHLNRLP